MASALERTTERLVVDYLTAYHSDAPGPVDRPTPEDFAVALAGLRSRTRRDGRLKLNPAVVQAIVRAERTILTLVALWPATLAHEAAAWELALTLPPAAVTD